MGNGEILARLPAAVGAVATVALPDGQLVVVVSSDDGKVRIWDLITGHPIGEPVTVGESHARPVATAVLWDPAEGGPSGEPVGSAVAPAVSLVTTILPDRRVVAIVGDVMGRVHFWDITTGRPEASPLLTLQVHNAPVSRLCTTTLPDGRAVLLSRTHRMTVCVSCTSYVRRPSPTGEDYRGWGYGRR
ncbi:hypothetical protein ACFCXS_25450 [Streptomyces sp. NPDC056373]|uniref:hypothetical protein n=1 Tax=Streptomyces sp. NPDC056373 TaxID=3345798 RepID=UPI0035D97BD4